MSDFICISQAFEQWQELAASIPKDDGPALAESWNDYTDSLAKDGQLCALQYHYCPAYDDAMPGGGSRWDALTDDRAFILAAMGIDMAARFVPFSQSRNKSESNPSLNWIVTLQYNGRAVIETDYMQGSGYCPAYSNPSVFPGTDRKHDKFMTAKRIREECETGKRSTGRLHGPVGVSLDPPSLADVLHALLLDASAIDSRDFPDWCADMGMSDDSIAARATYDACIAIAIKLRGAFGEQTLREINELFQGM